MRKRFLQVFSLVLALTLALGSIAVAESVSPVYPKSLKLSKKSASITIKYGGANTLKLKATTKPALTTLTEKLVWSSDNPSVATVDETGLVHAESAGTTYIRASIQGASKVLNVSCKVKVKEVRVKTIKLNASQIVLNYNSSSKPTYQLTAAVSPKKASFKGVTWSSSDEKIAKVDSNGLVTSVGNGRCTITASTDNGRKSAACDVLVRDASKARIITFSAGGDIVLGGDQKKKTDVFFSKLIEYCGYDYVLKNLEPVFRKDDFTILNLEGGLKGGKPKRPNREFNFYGKPEYAKILAAGSVEVANVVNNHINDFGGKGVTITALRNEGLTISDTTFSTAKNMIVVNDVRVGFLGFMVPTSTANMKRQVIAAKKKCDVVIVSIHHGNVPEHTHKVIASQRNVSRAMVDAGADVVLGHHTHVTSGIEVYKGKYIYYGLGSVESSGKKFSYLNFITQQKLSVDLMTGDVENQVPIIYPLCPTGPSKPAELPDSVWGSSRINNCQPVLLSPSDPRYHELLSIIDQESDRIGLNPAPYIKGNP